MIHFDFEISEALRLFDEIKKYRKNVTQDDLATIPCVCGKKLPVQTLKTLWTGHTRVIKNLCQDCEHNSKLGSIVVCNGCKSIEGFLTPQIDKEGFVIEKNKVYHQMACPNCRPNLLKTTFVEKAVFDFHKKNVTIPLQVWLETYNEYKKTSELYA
jgi:hypothetical protein